MRFVFDLDGTICTTHGTDYEKAEPFPRWVRQIRRLYQQGHTIVIYTARGSGTGKDWHEFTERQLWRWGVPFHELYCTKPYGDVYVDDKGCHSRDFERGWFEPNVG
jgi:hypothetical protein